MLKVVPLLTESQSFLQHLTAPDFRAYNPLTSKEVGFSDPKSRRTSRAHSARRSDRLLARERLGVPGSWVVYGQRIRTAYLQYKEAT